MNRFTNSPRTARAAFMVAACALAFSATLAAVQTDPHARPDETYISISGTVDSVAPDSFMLDYGDGLVRVEMDDESYEGLDPSPAASIVVSQTVVRGTVSTVEDGRFLVDTGRRLVRVDTELLPYDPLDDEGYMKIRKGDRVKVVGRMDTDLFEGRLLEADAVVKLYGG
ncbi:MAG: hypothetical protein RQ826_04460 [Xanthomonadales bacterium]|nr:hypothetical protein [Xanthomonadales bacterium]